MEKAMDEQNDTARLKELEEENARLRAQLAGDTQEDREVREFLEEFPAAEAFLDDLIACMEAHDTLCGREGLNKALTMILLDKYRDPAALAEDDAFFEAHIRPNGKIRQKIVEDYLNALEKDKAVCLRQGGLPQTRKEPIKTVRSAGDLARALFRK